MRRRRNCTALTIAALLLLPAGPARAALREGDRFPSLSVETWEGSSTTFSAATDEVVILEFWASWCIPCHDALPTLAHLAAQYGDARLRVVLINIDQDHAAAEQKLSAVIPDR
ncbi:MAG TPA: TlpA disulfide reductase family protein, partial [Candidatus Acidoferrales bacterium]|nr:TlpA disulfide reductase family protein [Candidatus Acidoferrales bacterium]